MSSPITKCPASGGDSIAQPLLCPLICACNQNPDVSKTGAQLKQQCVSMGLGALDESLGHGSPVKAEINYNMTKSPPEPIMNRQNPLKGTEHLPTRTKQIPGFEPGTGMVRRPDAVVVRDPQAPPTQANLLEVVEIKFPGDRYDEEQMQDYTIIAGKNAKLIQLSPEKCCCDNSTKQPVSTAKKVTASKLELLLLSLALVALVVDDVLPTGATQADDALIPVILARMATAF